jgi:monofunctional biosynthetic peptidoglycan transglycosylase
MEESRTPIFTRRFRIAGPGDAESAARLEQVLLTVPGVQAASADVHAKTLIVRTADYVTDQAIAEAVEAAGYTLLMDDTGDETQPKPSVTPAAPTRQPGWNRGSIWKNIWFYGSRLTVGAVALSLTLTIAYSFLPVPTTMLMLGEELLGTHTIKRNWVPLERISPNLIRSVIASEDAGFCQHWGFDFKGMEAAWAAAERGRRLRGASTISQQTAKNVFLWSGRSWIRKGLEAWFTVLIETIWTKRRIMEVYLNVIEWGPGVFGADAAARKWFGKPASSLSRLEAARLAAILPNPKRYRANPPGPYVKGRGHTISARARSVDLNGADRCARP